MAMELTVNEIAKAAAGELHLRGNLTGEESISSVVLDSRLAEAGGAFLAAPGEKVDGHRFIGQVYDKGVILVVTEKTPAQVEKEHGIPADSWGSYLLVRDSMEALRAIATYYRSKLQIPFVGITGSVGKTSTKEYVAAVLAQKYQVLRTEGNYNNNIGVPLTLLRIRPEHEVAVIEMGISHFGEMSELTAMVQPDVALITNIGECHLENLGDRDGVLRAKSEIFEGLDPDGEICLYGGDDKLRTVGEVKGKKPHFFGLGENPAEEVTITQAESRGLLGSEGKLNLPGENPVSVHIPLPGRHMVVNGAAAACVGRVLGLNQEEICRGIESIQPISGRNRIVDLGKLTLIDDCYNANPASMRASLDLLAMGNGSKVAILGDMFELGAEEAKLHRGVGEYAVGRADCVVFIGTLSKNGYDAAGEARSGGDGIFYYENKEAFLKDLEADPEAFLPEGCSVLVKASHGMAFPEIVKSVEKVFGMDK